MMQTFMVQEAAVRAHRPERSSWQGPLCMVAAMGCWSANDVLVKICAERLPVGPILAIRGAFALALLLMLMGLARERMTWSTLKNRAVALRCSLEVGAAATSAWALSQAALAVVTGLSMLAPLLVVAAATLLGWERASGRAWFSGMLGLLGALLTIAPWGAQPTGIGGMVAALACAFCLAARDLSTRHLSTSLTPRALTIVTTATVCGVGILAWAARPAAAAVSFDPATIGSLAAAACCATAGNLLLVGALRKGELGQVMPFRFTLLAWAAGFGWLIWRETLTTTSVLGLVLIGAAGIGALKGSRPRRP